MSIDINMDVISVADIIDILKNRTKRSWRTDDALAFASDLTGLSEDMLSELISKRDDNAHITLDMVKRGLREGCIRIIDCPDAEEGVVAKIGEYWFYFSDRPSSGMLHADEYLRKRSSDDIASAVYETLEELKSEDPNEYGYYLACLLENEEAVLAKERAYSDAKRDRMAYDKYLADCHDEDIRSRVDELIEDGRLQKDCKIPSSDDLERALGKNDTYWDVFWQTVDYVIFDANLDENRG